MKLSLVISHLAHDYSLHKGTIGLLIMLHVMDFVIWPDNFMPQ